MKNKTQKKIYRTQYRLYTIECIKIYGDFLFYFFFITKQQSDSFFFCWKAKLLSLTVVIILLTLYIDSIIQALYRATETMVHTNAALNQDFFPNCTFCVHSSKQCLLKIRPFYNLHLVMDQCVQKKTISIKSSVSTQNVCVFITSVWCLQTLQFQDIVLGHISLKIWILKINYTKYNLSIPMALQSIELLDS